MTCEPTRGEGEEEEKEEEEEEEERATTTSCYRFNVTVRTAMMHDPAAPCSRVKIYTQSHPVGRSMDRVGKGIIGKIMDAQVQQLSLTSGPYSYPTDLTNMPYVSDGLASVLYVGCARSLSLGSTFPRQPSPWHYNRT